jgi:UTP--glucose-1-phosphate uridylyltransferase
VLCAAELVQNDSFYVLLGDVLVPDNQLLLRMRQVSEQHDDASVIAVIAVPLEDVSRFGVIDGQLVSGNASDGSAVWQLNGLVEKPAVEDAPSNLAVFGRYLLTPKVMQLLAHTAPGAGGEIQLTDALAELLQTQPIYAIEVAPDEGFDCGTIANWLDTNIRLALRNPALAPTVHQSIQA